MKNSLKEIIERAFAGKPSQDRCRRAVREALGLAADGLERENHVDQDQGMEIAIARLRALAATLRDK